MGEIGMFDAGFKLVGVVEAGIERCVIRLALNCTFGKTPDSKKLVSHYLSNFSKPVLSLSK